MKVSDEHFKIIKDAVEPHDTDAQRERYRNRQIHNAAAVSDIDKRYRWDLYYYAARLNNGLPDSTSGYSMTHIDTALRKIVKPL